MGPVRRVHRTEGDHVLVWNSLRTFGPALRFDPHPLPKGEHPGQGVWRAASTPGGATPARPRLSLPLSHPDLTSRIDGPRDASGTELCDRALRTEGPLLKWGLLRNEPAAWSAVDN